MNQNPSSAGKWPAIFDDPDLTQPGRWPAHRPSGPAGRTAEKSIFRVAIALGSPNMVPKVHENIKNFIPVRFWDRPKKLKKVCF